MFAKENNCTPQDDLLKATVILDGRTTKEHYNNKPV